MTDEHTDRLFGVYEAGGTDQRFVRVFVGSSYGSARGYADRRNDLRMSKDRPPITEQRIVPAEARSTLVLDADVDELRELIQQNNELYP